MANSNIQLLVPQDSLILLGYHVSNDDPCDLDKDGILWLTCADICKIVHTMS